MPKQQRSSMEKSDSWNVGDIVESKEKGPRSLYEIMEIRLESDGSKRVFCESIDSVNIDRVVDYLMYMDKFWVNLGNSKYWKVLYGPKGKDSTNKLSDKG